MKRTLWVGAIAALAVTFWLMARLMAQPMPQPSGDPVMGRDGPLTALWKPA